MEDKKRKTKKTLEETSRDLREQLLLDFILPEDIPELDLYMEQLTTYMDQHLSNNSRDENERTLTKTMINNYTKNGLLPPPEKKKYSPKQLILLIYIYYLKNVVSITDIRRLLEPLQKSEPYSDEDQMALYQQIFQMEKQQYFNIEDSVERAYEICRKKLADPDDEYLSRLSLICLLGYDIFSKKRMIEHLIDELASEEEEKAEKEIEEKKIAAAKEKAAAKERKKPAKTAPLRPKNMQKHVKEN